MKELKEYQRNNLRFKRLSQEKKDALNELAMNEFKKPFSERIKPVSLLDKIEF